MTREAELVARLGPAVVWLAASLAAAASAAVVVERLASAARQAWQRRVDARYEPLVQRALAGDAAALGMLVSCAAHHRLRIAALLILPLLHDRDPDRIAATRHVVEAMSLGEDARRMLGSRRWWRRAVAIRAFGLLQDRRHAANIVAALDDRHADVRAAALDALADLQDPSTIPALVVRLIDTSLHRGRRAAALAAFGDAAEPFVLELAGVTSAHRPACARALAICGTAAARPALCRWIVEDGPDVRAAALDALAHTGLDDDAAGHALAALASPHVLVRAAAARALRGWNGSETAAQLAQHLDDEWPVATAAAAALRTIGPAGQETLLRAALRPDLAGLLARQVLWRAETAR